MVQQRMEYIYKKKTRWTKIFNWVSRDGAMAKRGGMKKKSNKKIANINWLLFEQQTPQPWATAQK